MNPPSKSHWDNNECCMTVLWPCNGFMYTASWRYAQKGIITGRVAKRVKVMFLQACIIHSVQLGGGGAIKCIMGWVIWSRGGGSVLGRGGWTFTPRVKGQPPAPRVKGQPPPPGSKVNHLLPGRTTVYARAGGTHPTGMRFCLFIRIESWTGNTLEMLFVIFKRCHCSVSWHNCCLVPSTKYRINLNHQ